MSLITQEGFRERMAKLDSTQESIQNTSSWMLLDRDNARNLAVWWEAYFSRADQDKRLSMIYLVNDVLQNSRKKGSEFIGEFYKVLPRALRHFLSKASGKTKERVERVITVWEERRVFGSNSTKLRELIGKTEVPVSSSAAGGGGARGGQHHHTQQQPAAAQPPRPSSHVAPAVAAPAMPQIPAAADSIVATFMRVDAAAAHSNQLAASAAVVRPNAASAATTPDQRNAAAAVLRGYVSALQTEVHARQAAVNALARALDDARQAEATAAANLHQCSTELAILEGREVPAPIGAAPVPESEAPNAGVSAEDDAAAEAAALAAQLVGDPSALSLFQEALTAAGAAATGPTGGEMYDDDEEYDPEDAFN